MFGQAHALPMSTFRAFVLCRGYIGRGASDCEPRFPPRQQPRPRLCGCGGHVALHLSSEWCPPQNPPPAGWRRNQSRSLVGATRCEPLTRFSAQSPGPGRVDGLRLFLPAGGVEEGTQPGNDAWPWAALVPRHDDYVWGHGRGSRAGDLLDITRTQPVQVPRGVTLFRAHVPTPSWPQGQHTGKREDICTYAHAAPATTRADAGWRRSTVPVPGSAGIRAHPDVQMCRLTRALRDWHQ